MRLETDRTDGRARVMRVLSIAFAGAFVLGGCRSLPPSAAPATCVEDVRASFRIVANGYAGYAEKRARVGADTIERTQSEALRRAESAGPGECLAILNSWLDVFGTSRLRASGSAAKWSGAEPQFEILSDDATLIRVGTSGSHTTVEKLVADHRLEITKRSDLVIDLRGSANGADGAFGSLTSLARSGPVRSEGFALLASPENAAALQQLVAVLDTTGRGFVQALIPKVQERTGEWVEVVPDQLKRGGALMLPARVAVLVDGGVEGEAERFLLEARQSAKVRLFGSVTKGDLDYRTTLPHRLPSGLMLWADTARSNRLPASPFDGIGIQPDVELEPTLFDGAKREAALRRVLDELHAAVSARTPDELTVECRADLVASFGIVERNYAGWADKIARYGAETVERAQLDSLRRLESEGPALCIELLNAWLEPLHEGHLAIAETNPFEPPPPAPNAGPPVLAEFEVLSEQASLIRARSFMPFAADELARVIQEHRAEIVARPELVIDVRGNGGGSDTSWFPLAELVYSQPVSNPGLDALVTPENIAATERILPSLDSLARLDFERGLARMRAAGPGWLRGASMTITREPLQQPSRVAVLIDGRCGSSCEAFLLEARQSEKVRLIGRPTGGNLDYGNMFPHPLPSGRTVWASTTRSRRLPENPIDDTGILPDVEMDPALFDGAMRSEALARVIQELRARAD